MFCIIYCQMPLLPNDVFQETMCDILDCCCPSAEQSTRHRISQLWKNNVSWWSSRTFRISFNEGILRKILLLNIPIGNYNSKLQLPYFATQQSISQWCFSLRKRKFQEKWTSFWIAIIFYFEGVLKYFIYRKVFFWNILNYMFFPLFLQIWNLER